MASCALAAAGLLPVLVLVGLRLVSIPLAPLTGAIMAALAAAGCLALGGSVLLWFVGIALVAGLSAAVFVARYPGSRPWVRPSGGARPTGSANRFHRGAGMVGAAVIALAVVGSLSALRAPHIGFDARTIWLLHAVWFTDGHRTALAALSNPAIPFAHASYPPLIGGSVAISWLITGNRSDTLGVVMIALLNACAVSIAAWAVVEVGRHCGSRVAAAHAHHQALPPRRGRLEAPYVAGVVVAGLLVLVAFGVAGPFATNGYADLLWSAAAVGAIGFALVLPGRRGDLWVGVLLLSVAGLTKQEGTATAVAIVVLITVRFAHHEWAQLSGVPWRPLGFGAIGVLALGAWPFLMVLLGASQNVAVFGVRQGDLVSRTHQTVVAMSGHLHVLAFAVPIAIAGGIALGQVRRASGLRNDGWAWAALALGAFLVAGTYITGPGNVGFWLDTSVHRTTFFPAICAWWIIGTWAVLGTAQAMVPRTSDPPVEAQGTGRPLDEGPPPVLHHPS